jgi:hypothetical protein
MNTLTIILLIYVILDIISNLILITLMKRKGIRLTDLANRLRWLCKKEEPITEDEDEDWYEYDDYDFIRNADENDVDDQGYGY